MKKILFFITIVLFCTCSKKGPQTYSSPMVGQTKTDLITEFGEPSEIRIYDESEIYIYKKKEEVFRKDPELNPNIKPYKTLIIEHIYYINTSKIIYKYQVWRKKG